MTVTAQLKHALEKVERQQQQPFQLAASSATIAVVGPLSPHGGVLRKVNFIPEMSLHRRRTRNLIPFHLK